MTAQQDWEGYARLMTEVGAVGAGERHRRAEREARRARDREDAEAAVQASVQRKQALEQRIRDLEAHAAAVLHDAGVSTTGKQIVPSLAPIRDTDDAHRTIDRLGRELDQVAARLHELRARRTGQGLKLLAAVVLIWVPVAARLLIYALADGNSMEALVGGINTALGMAAGYRYARLRPDERSEAFVVLFVAFCGLIPAALAFVVVSAFGVTVGFLCLVLMTFLWISAFRGVAGSKGR